MTRTHVVAFLSLVIALILAPPTGAAQFYGPSPYLSLADSPFAGLGLTNFILEDFEDGALNVPGVHADFPGSVTAPGAVTDSVDGDDGAIDGSGQGGRSWHTDNTRASFTFWGRGPLGGLPTHVGIVWTDVGTTDDIFGEDYVHFEAWGADGLALGAICCITLGDGAITGATAEDRFFGVYHPFGISKIHIASSTSMDWEVDHLQLGGVAAVPLPAALWMFGPALAFLGYRRYSSV